MRIARHELQLTRHKRQRGPVLAERNPAPLPTTPVVLFTAYAEIELAVQGLKDGAADFVTKPWNNARLLQTLLHAATQTGNQPHNRPDDSPVNPPATTLEQMEQRMISEALADNGGNLSATAERLGITRQTLYNKLKRHHLQ